MRKSLRSIMWGILCVILCTSNYETQAFFWTGVIKGITKGCIKSGKISSKAHAKPKLQSKSSIPKTTCKSHHYGEFLPLALPIISQNLELEFFNSLRGSLFNHQLRLPLRRNNFDVFKWNLSHNNVHVNVVLPGPVLENLQHGESQTRTGQELLRELLRGVLNLENYHQKLMLNQNFNPNRVYRKPLVNLITMENSYLLRYL